MKLRIWLCVLIMFFFSAPIASAVSAVSKKTIAEAQKYGIESIAKPAADFFKPWLAYEAQAESLNETTEYACLYTPFLLIASDAREKTINSLELSDGQDIIGPYRGYLVFGATLCSDEPNFIAGAKISLQQENVSIAVSQAIIPLPQKKSATIDGTAKTFYLANCYFYFEQQKFDLNKPAVLTVILQNKQERRFYFNLANLN